MGHTPSRACFYYEVERVQEIEAQPKQYTASAKPCFEKPQILDFLDPPTAGACYLVILKLIETQIDMLKRTP